MALEGLASAQARISAIQDKINSLSNNGRPPVSITESSSSTSNTQSVNTSSSAFATEMAKQVASANLSSSTPTTAAGQVQGIPGTAEAFLEKVRSYIGVPYVWGGTDPKTGLDCSGLVQTAARDVGVNLPRVTYDQRHAGIEVNGIKNARPGDLIITNNSGHVVVYAGNGRIIHAPRPGLKVQEAPLSDAGEIVTIRRVMRSASDSPAVQSSKVSAQASVAASAANLAQNGGLAALLGANSSLTATGFWVRPPERPTWLTPCWEPFRGPRPPGATPARTARCPLCWPRPVPPPATAATTRPYSASSWAAPPPPRVPTPAWPPWFPEWTPTR